MEPCKYCNKMFKHIVIHINKCPARQGDTEVAGMTPCRYCKKMFKRVSGHVYRCPENPEKNLGMSGKKTTRKDSSSEEVDDNEETVNMTPCRYCKKMFKRVAGHVYRCPENPEKKLDMSGKKTTRKDSSEEEVDDNEETVNMTPCRHCKKMFKRVTAHVYRCPKNPKNDLNMSGKKTTRKDSSSEEVDDNEETVNMTPCRYCKKMFKQVAGHVYRCPENPEKNLEMPRKRITENVLPSNDHNCEEAANITPCDYCKKSFGFEMVHHSNCPCESSESIQKENVAENATDFDLTTSLSKPSKYNDTDTFFDQSENTSKFSAVSFFCSSPNTRCTEYEKSEFDEATSELARPPIHGACVLSPKQKKPGRRLYPDLDKLIPDHSCDNSYESWETESGSTSTDLKRPPIHNSHYLHRNVEAVNGSGRDEYTLLDSTGDSFYQLSDSEDSFVYLNQDLKRPPIHADVSPLMKDSDKNQQFNNKEEEFFDFQHHASRE